MRLRQRQVWQALLQCLLGRLQLAERCVRVDQRGGRWQRRRGHRRCQRGHRCDVLRLIHVYCDHLQYKM